MPNLKELKVSVGKIPGLNLGEHLSGNNGLQHLHLVLSSPGAAGGRGRPSTNLHRELQSPLPVSLSRVSVEASKLPILHPAALKVSVPTSKHPVNPKSMSTAKSREVGRKGINIALPSLSALMMMLLCHLIYVRTFNAGILCIRELLMLFPHCSISPRPVSTCLSSRMKSDWSETCSSISAVSRTSPSTSRDPSSCLPTTPWLRWPTPRPSTRSASPTLSFSRISP